ncbi:hypothetical protein MTO96_016390 [Rhipicephalus appendiculatus]
MSLNVGLSFGLHVRWLFFSVSLLAFLVGLVLSEGPASVMFACLVDTMIRIWYDDTVRMFSLQSSAFGIRRVSETRGSLSGSEQQPIDQQTTSESSKYHTGSESRPESMETVAVAVQKGAATTATEGQPDPTTAGQTRHRVSISLSADHQKRDSIVSPQNDSEMQRRGSDTLTKDDKLTRKRRPSVVFVTALESEASPSDAKYLSAKPSALSTSDLQPPETKPRRPSILKDSSRFPEPSASSTSDLQPPESKPRRPSILKDSSRFPEAGIDRAALAKVDGESNTASSRMPLLLARSTTPSVPLGYVNVRRRSSAQSLDSLADEESCSMVLDKEVQERVYEGLRRTFLMGPTLVIISATSTSCFQYPAWAVLNSHLSITPTMMWHWTLITFPSCVLSSALGLLYVYVFMFKQYEYVLDPALQPRMLRFTARHLRKTPQTRCKELLYMVFLTSYGCFYLLARMAGTDDEDAQLCVLCSMVIATSAVTFEQRQEEKQGDATDCWSRFPWHMVLLLGAVQVVSKIIEAVSTRMHPIYYAIPVAVAASSNLIMPITLPLVILHEMAEVPLRHLVFAGLLMKTALLFTLIISMNTTAEYIFYISPAVKALNSTGPASRHEAPHY